MQQRLSPQVASSSIGVGSAFPCTRARQACCLRALMSRVALRFCHHHFDIFQSARKDVKSSVAAPRGTGLIESHPRTPRPLAACHATSRSTKPAHLPPRELVSSRGAARSPITAIPVAGRAPRATFATAVRVRGFAIPHEEHDLARSAGEPPAVAGPRPSHRGAR